MYTYERKRNSDRQNKIESKGIYSWNKYTKGEHTVYYATNMHNRAFTVNRKDATLLYDKVHLYYRNL